MHDAAGHRTRQGLQGLRDRRIAAANAEQVCFGLSTQMALQMPTSAFSVLSCNGTQDYLRITDCADSIVLCDTPNYARLITTSASNSMSVEFSSTPLGFTNAFQKGLKIYVEVIDAEPACPNWLPTAPAPTMSTPSFMGFVGPLNHGKC